MAVKAMKTYKLEYFDGEDWLGVGGGVDAISAKAAIRKYKAAHPSSLYRGKKFRAHLAMQRNPHATKFPKGKFVKVQAVRVNRDGTITVKK